MAIDHQMPNFGLEAQHVYERAPFGELVVAMVTPFKDNERQDVDYGAAQRLAGFLTSEGVQGLVIAGTTGEAPTLTHDEHVGLASAIAEIAEVPVLVGTGSNNTREAVDLTRRVSRVPGICGVLVVDPYYNRPTQEGIEDYYNQVAGSTDLPVVVYDIPVRTGNEITEDTMVKLAGIDNVIAVKDATGEFSRTKRLLPQLGELGVVVYSGNDSQNLQLAKIGAVGAVSVAGHWAAREMTAMFDALREGNHSKAKALDSALEPSYRFESTNQARNPIPTKIMMDLIFTLGGGGDRIRIGAGRSPMVASQETMDRVREEAANILVDLATRTDS